MVDTSPEQEKWKLEQRIRAAERAHEGSDKDWHQANEGAMAIGNIALRTAVLINGGAAVASLTFIGSLINSKSIALGPNLVTLTGPLIWFAMGVASATIAMGFGYLTNYSNAGIVSGRTKIYESPYFLETTTSKRWRISSTVFTILSIISATASLGLFICGMVAIRTAITTVN
jgi:hypothetical protein